MKLDVRIIFPSIVLLIVLVFMLRILNFPWKAQAFPLVIAVPLAALLVLQLFKVCAGRKHVTAEEGEEGIPSGQYLAGLMWVGAFLLMIYLLGFLTGIPLFILLYMKLHRQSWFSTGIVTAISVAIVFVFMYGLRHLEWYEGLIFQLVGW